MNRFSEKYFEREERSEYLVGETIKRVWASQIVILQEIIKICENNNLRYFAFWGTLLGAVRHQGFIPWDDDLDIAMLGEDYERFLEIAAKELPVSYELVNAYTSNKYDSHFTRIVNRHNVDVWGKESEEYYGCPFIMGIDIFPLYYVPREERSAEEQKQILRYIRQMDDIIDFKNNHPEMTEEEKKEYGQAIAQGLLDIQQMTGYKFVADRPLNVQLLMVYDQICRLFNANESDYVANFPRYVDKGWHLFEKKNFEEFTQLPFENMMITVPKAYDVVLKKLYGNYLIPKNTNKMDEHKALNSQAHALGNVLERFYFQSRNNNQSIHINAVDITAKPLSDEEIGNMVSAEMAKKIFFVDEKNKKCKKKIILFYISIEKMLLRSEYVIEKIKKVLGEFEGRDDVLLWWLASFDCDGKDTCLRNFIPDTLARYHEIVEENCDTDFCLYDTSGNISRAIMLSDAYFGDDGLIAPIYKASGKWMMIQNYLI